MEITRNPDVKEVQKITAHALGEALFRARDGEILLLLSGGSSFEILPEVSSEVFGGHLTIGMLDERYDRSPSVNNFLQFQKMDFYRRAKERDALFIESTPKANESLENFAGSIEARWNIWRNENKDGKIIITEGVGVDGHTAGIMPFPENPKLFTELFLDNERWVTGYNADAKNQYPNRATATLSFLKKVDIAIVYITGKAKEPVFEKIISETGTLAETPARIIREMKEVKMFTDIIN